MLRANETLAYMLSKEEEIQDRKNFVVNLGKLLSQTRNGIQSAYLDDEEVVHVIYEDGYVESINVRYDSYSAIIKDVVSAIG